MNLFEATEEHRMNEETLELENSDDGVKGNSFNRPEPESIKRKERYEQDLGTDRP